MIQSLEELTPVKKYLDRIGATPTSLFAASIKETIGAYWQERARIKFHRDGNVTITPGMEHLLPTAEEAEEIKTAFMTADFPSGLYIENPPFPKELTEADPENVFVFRDEKNRVLMCQLRTEIDGNKAYIPYSYWTDFQWRRCEPPTDLLPLYGLDSIKNNTTVIISEGSKTARAIERIIRPKTREQEAYAEEWPWTKEFSYAASVGFIGGALASQRTDWGVLKKLGITRAIIVADQDYYGRDAINKIAEKLDMPTFAMTFTDDFQTGWDCADPIPSHLYRTIGSRRYYIGPSFTNLVQPATFLTNLVTVMDEKGKAKKVPVLRNHVIPQWIYAEDANMLISVDFPKIQLNPESFDRVMRPFSHCHQPSELLLREFSCRVKKLAYRPDLDKRRILSDGEIAVNLYQHTPIVSREGDITPFLEFMEYLVPDAEERKTVMRWAATVVSKPSVRPLFGLLMISENTGIGKTLLGERILAPLVGMDNASFPSEATLSENFNSWLGLKRLIVIGELYSGQSWRMANKLKSYITDTKITLRELYKTGVVVDNFAAFYCSSNSSEPLKIEERDRRWFIPSITEERWPDSKFDAFYEWLDSGGLSIIKYYFDHFKDYLRQGEKSPMSVKKTEIIDAGKSSAVNRLGDLAFKISEMEVAIGDRDCHDWLELVTGSKAYETLLEIRKYLKEKGMTEAKVVLPDSRMFYNSKQQTVLLSQKLLDKVSNMGEDADVRSYIKERLKVPAEIMNNVQM